jgi:hypothetical protein
MNNKIARLVEFFKGRSFRYYEIFNSKKHRIDSSMTDENSDTNEIADQLIKSLKELETGAYNVKMYKAQNGSDPFTFQYDTTNGISQQENPTNIMDNSIMFQISTMLATIQLAQAECNKKVDFIYEYCKESERLRKDADKEISKVPKKDTIDRLTEKADTIIKGKELLDQFMKKQ